MQSVCPDDFITEENELILYPKEPKHKTIYGDKRKYRWKCHCGKDKYANGVCDNIRQCNKFECFWDGHDCDFIEPKNAYYRDRRESYHQSVDYTQLVLDRKFYGPGNGVANRTWNSHMPMMLDKRILEDIWNDFPLETNLTRYSTHFRSQCRFYDPSFQARID